MTLQPTTKSLILRMVAVVLPVAGLITLMTLGLPTTVYGAVASPHNDTLLSYWLPRSRV